MPIWLPPKVSKELRESTESYREELLAARQLKGVLDDFNRDLKEIDPYLELAWFDDVQVLGVIPNRYHIIRHNPGAPPGVIPHVGPDGEYRPADSSIFDKVREADLWHDQANFDRRKKMEAAERAKERRKQRETEERQDEIKERWDAVSRTQVSMTPGWSQNHAGRRGRRP